MKFLFSGLGYGGRAINLDGISLLVMGLALWILLIGFCLLRRSLIPFYPLVFFFLNIFLGFGIAIYSILLRSYMSSTLSSFGSVLVIFYVSSVNPYSHPSGAGGSPNWSEFDLGVLEEPFPTVEVNQPLPPAPQVEPAPPANPVEHPIRPYIGLESSMRNRVFLLNQQQCVFLFDQGDTYWAELKAKLRECPSQEDYSRLLDFENRELQILEEKHKVHRSFTRLLVENPALGQQAPYHPHEICKEVLNEKEDTFFSESAHLPSSERYAKVINQFTSIWEDLEERGSASRYFIEFVDG